MDASFQYQVVREEIRAEHALIGNRLTWYVTSQSFLVTAFAISCGNAFSWFHWFSTILLPALGITASALIAPSIIGACETIKLWHQKQEEIFQCHSEFRAAFSVERPSWIEKRGLLFPKLIPLLFGFFWLIIYIVSYFR